MPALVNRHQDAKLAVKGHASVGYEEVVNQEEISALPAKADGRAVNRGVDATQIGEPDRISVAHSCVEWTPVQKRVDSVAEKPAHLAGASGCGHEGGRLVEPKLLARLGCSLKAGNESAIGTLSSQFHCTVAPCSAQMRSTSER